jgi:hypothetical protein
MTSAYATSQPCTLEYMTVTSDVASIYTLSDPRTDAVRYVGMTVYPLAKRLGGHLKYKGKDHKSTWIRSLRSAGITPVITEIAVVSIEARVEAEQRWIAYYRAHGADLTNSTKGGVGCLGYKHTDEAKAKMSKAHKGVPSEKRGIPNSEEQNEKCRQAMIRHFQDPAKREAVGRVHKGKKISDEHKRATSEGNRKRWAQWRADAARSEEVCPRGHPFDHVTSSGRRQCKTCRADAQRERITRLKQEHVAPEIPCKCRCGEMIPATNWRGQPRSYRPGHQQRAVKRAA